MNTTKTLEELDLLIRARYPLINIISPETARVTSALETILKDHEDKKMFSWVFGEGMTCLGERKNLTVDEKGMLGKELDPLLVLDKIEIFGKNSLFILNDFHLFLKDTRVLIKLKSVTSRIRMKRSTLVFISPCSFPVPPELRDHITTISFPLPGSDEMEGLYQNTLSRVCIPGQKLDNISDTLKEKIVNSALGLTFNQAERVLFKALTKNGKISEEAIDRILEEKKQLISLSSALQFFPATETIKNVGGLYSLKEWVRSREKVFSKEAREYGLPVPKGVLLAGIPGTGKSLVAKAVAGMWKMPLLRLDVGAIFGGLVGQSEENVRTAIAISEAVAPCCLWVD